jgi:hypothetical protein
MKDIRYNIHDFVWEKDSNHFYGNARDLWDTDNYYKYPFPNGKKQFFIHNPTTGGFRRFRFSHELIVGDDVVWYFQSEDGINVEILAL